MADRNSITSFEDIAERFRDGPESEGLTSSSSEDLANDSEEEVPDVLYVLQCKELGKGLVEGEFYLANHLSPFISFPGSTAMALL